MALLTKCIYHIDQYKCILSVYTNRVKQQKITVELNRSNYLDDLLYGEERPII